MKNTKIEEIIEKLKNKEVDYKDLSPGEKVIALSYEATQIRFDSEYIVISKIVWEDVHEDLIAKLKEFGVEKVVIADSSTALMKLIHSFMKKGCFIEKPVSVKCLGNSYCDEDPGLLVNIKG